MTSNDGTDPPVELLLPGTSRHIRLARLMASGIATTYGLTLDVVEDARIAVDEICASLIEAGGGQTLHLAFQVEQGALCIAGRTDASDSHGLNQRRLAISRRILDVLTDEHDFSQVDGHAEFTVSIPLRSGDHATG